MSRVAYVNGRYLRHAEAQVHVEDRGYQFSDGVYEVILIKNGKMIDEEQHLERLKKSLSSLEKGIISEDQFFNIHSRLPDEVYRFFS